VFTFFAHEGHEHTPEPVFFDTTHGIILINLAPFVVLAVLLLIINKVWHVKQSWQIGLTLVYLLTIGLLGYRYFPVASIISLVAGFGLSLALVILPFKKT
jgi:hypothetical protein